MALNLSTLTNASTSATVLAEAQTTADFLDSVPILKNIARGSNKGGDGKQTTALNQPKALPVVDGKGYLYVSGVSGNYASVPDATNLNGLTDFVMEAKDVYMGDWAAASPALETFFSKYTGGNEAFSFRRYGANINFYALYGGVGTHSDFPHGLTGAATASIRVTRVGTSVTAELDTGSGYAAIGSAQTVPADAIDTGTAPIEIGGLLNGSTQMLLGKISRAVIWDNGTQAGDPVLDVDFTATNIRHNDTKFQCATGQTVTINQSGNDPATVIKRSVLRFANQSNNTTSIALQGLLNQTIDSGYMFAAFSVLGDGGEPTARIFSINSTGAFDSDSESAIFSLRNNTNPADLFSYNAQWFSGHGNMFNDDNGDILHQSLIKNGTQKSLVNGAGVVSSTNATTISSEEFNIVVNDSGVTNNAAIDLEYLALFPATITDAEAARVVNYINNRNNVFDLKDSLGYYFFDPTDLAAGPVASWNGQIVGSDNDANLTITQTTAGSQPDSPQPTGSGMAVTFNDNNDHLDVPAEFVEPAAGSWQVVGTSLGTFAYKVNANAVTELNLLGNLGSASYRQAGDLYGIILLPETAIGADIEAARKLLIDRGAADGALAASYYTAWHSRNDIVEFKSANTSSLTNCGYAWSGCSNLGSFPSLDLSSSNNFVSTWYGCSSMSNFGPTEMSNGTNFSSAWQGCAALTSFPAGAKLGTAASNVNFSLAFYLSGLTSLPDNLDMSQGDTFVSVFQSTPVTSIGTGVLLGTAAASPTVNFASAFQSCASLAALPDNLDLSQGDKFNDAFYGCTSLATIGTGVLLGTAASNVNFTSVFRISGLTALPAGLDMSQGSSFASAFSGCTSLTTIGSGVLLGTASSNVNFAGVFRTCTALESLPAGLDMSQGNTFDGAFFDCSSLTTIGNGVLLGTASSSVEFSYAFYNTGLTELPANLNLSQGDSFYATFQNCSSLVTFPAGAFDTMGTPADYCFYNAWLGCGSLSGASVDAILDSIEASGQLAPSTGPDITITYNTATGTPLYDSVPSLFARGWNVMVNSVAVTNTSATDLIIDSMAISTLSVVSGLSPVYNRLGNPAEYGDNISRIGNLGTDANDPVQTVEAEQPVFRAVGNEADYGDGYLYLDGVAGSYASVPDAANLNGLTDFVMEAKDVYMDDWATGNETFFSKFGSGAGGSAFTFRRTTGSINFYAVYGNVGVNSYFSHGLTGAATASIRITRVGTSVTAELDTGSGYVAIGNTQTVPAVAIDTTLAPVEIGGREIGTVQPLTGKIGQATIWDNGAQTGDPVLDVDFRNATHKLTDTDTLTATSGQTITLNGGATVYNPPIAPLHGYLHLSGVAGNYASVSDVTNLVGLGDFVMEAKDVHIPDWTASGSDAFVSIYAAGGYSFLFRRTNTSVQCILLFSGSAPDSQPSFAHGLTGAATASFRILRSGASISMEMDTGAGYITMMTAASTTETLAGTAGTLEIGARDLGVNGPLLGKIGQARIWDNGTAAGTAVLDVNFATDPALESDTSFTASSGQTVTIHQSTITGDRAKIVKNSEIFYDGQNDEFNFSLSSTFTGKMLVASTQGILVADVSRAGATQIDEKGVASITGFSAAHGLEQKGVMLLSDSSSPAALTSAFVARGAVKSFAARTTFTEAFRNMELTSFPTIDVSNGVDCSFAWDGYRGTTFPPLNFASATSLYAAWYNSTSLTSVSAIQAPVCTNFGSAWQNNTALATIDPNANFGESATGVNFSSAFRTTGLTALPAGLDMSQGFTFSSAFSGCGSLATIGTGVLLGTANATATVNFGYVFKATGLTALPAGLDMSQGSVFTSAFQSCGSLTTIGTGVLLGTASSNVNFQNAFLASGLTELPANLNLSQGDTFQSAFQSCGSLTTIGTGVLLGTASSNVNFTNAFYGCTNLVTLPANLNLSSGNHFNKTFYNCSSLVDFPAGAFDTLGTPVSSCFFFTWLGCLALSTTSVENILSSINTSGQSAPAVGPEIFITYNVATGALSAATNTAIASLQGKGWTIVINGTTLLP